MPHLHYMSHVLCISAAFHCTHKYGFCSLSRASSCLQPTTSKEASALIDKLKRQQDMATPTQIDKLLEYDDTLTPASLKGLTKIAATALIAA